MVVDSGKDLYGGGQELLTFPVCDQYTIQGDLFSKAVLEGTEVPEPLEDSIRNMECIEAVFRSAESGRWERPGPDRWGLMAPPYCTDDDGDDVLLRVASSSVFQSGGVTPSRCRVKKSKRLCSP